MATARDKLRKIRDDEHWDEDAWLAQRMADYADDLIAQGALRLPTLQEINGSTGQSVIQTSGSVKMSKSPPEWSESSGPSVGSATPSRPVLACWLVFPELKPSAKAISEQRCSQRSGSSSATGWEIQQVCFHGERRTPKVARSFSHG